MRHTMDQQAIDQQVSHIMTLLGPSKTTTQQSLVQAIVATMGSLVLPKINELCAKVVTLEDRIKGVENKLVTVDQMQMQLTNLEAECTALKNNNARLRESARRAAQLALSNKRYSHQFNLLLHGVSETQPDLKGATDASDPAFRRSVLGELKKFDPTIAETDFERAHRLGPPKQTMEGAQEPCPRAIVITFYNRYVRDRLLEESIRRYKERKMRKPQVTTGVIHKDTYLTSHRVRDTIENQGGPTGYQLDTGAPPDREPGGKWREETWRPPTNATADRARVRRTRK